MRKLRNQLIACLLILWSSTGCAYSQQSDSLLKASDFGASSSLSFGVFGFDFISSSFRCRISNKCLLMTGIGLKPLMFDGYKGMKTSYTVSAGGIISLRKSFNQEKNMLVDAGGIYCVGGYSFGGTLEPFGSLTLSYFSIGYHYERFFEMKTNNSLSLMVGPKISLIQSKANFNYDIVNLRTKVLPSIFIRIQYNLLFNHKK